MGMEKENMTERSHEQTTSVAGWGRIEVAPTAIMSVPYHNFRVPLYQKSVTVSQEDEYQFYYAPLLLLQPDSAKSIFNPFTKNHQVIFDVIMWDDKLEKHIQAALIEKIKMDIPLFCIRPLPVEQIRLEALEYSPTYTVNTNWQSNAMNSNRITFRVKCTDRTACDELAESIRDYPNLFVDTITVHYSLEAQKVGRRAITITAQHVRTASLATQLDQKFPESNIVYMQADDAKELVMEITTNVMASEIMDGDFVNHDQSLNIMNVLKSALDLTSTGTDSFSEQMWESTFWHDDNARPDKVTRTLNEVYDKSDSETKALMKRELAAASKSFNKNAGSAEVDSHQSGGIQYSAQSDRSNENTFDQSSDASSKGHFTGGGSFGLFSAKADAGSESTNKSNLKTANKSQASAANDNESSWDNSTHKAVSKASENSAEFSKDSKNEDDRLDSLLNEARSIAQWDGEQFVPKAMELTRLNMSALRSSATLGTVQVQITQTTATLSSKINVPPPNTTKCVSCFNYFWYRPR